ncbi:hypothetical protein MRB53_039417 [Persea americana]|nr:hypothetical protein MRB53_039417 [Persea americana]
MWRFTVLWTLIFYGFLHIVTSGYAVILQWRNWKVIWIVPLVYIVIGGVEAVLAGSIVGGLPVMKDDSCVGLYGISDGSEAHHGRIGGYHFALLAAASGKARGMRP